jgi:DNA-binding transcriptional LysR family regulator
MDSLVGITTFVQAAEIGSFAEAGRVLGISASAVGKTIVRLEEQYKVRLFHRSTRSIKLTAEGEMFLTRCHRILNEVAAAEAELLNASALPRGRLRISVPQLTDLVMPVVHGFMQAFPDVDVDLDLSDRMVDIVEEGFDVVIRTGEQVDSRLVSRKLGVSRRVLVGSTDYFERQGVPETPADLLEHRCLIHRFPASGRLERWRLKMPDGGNELPLRETRVFSTVESITFLVRHGDGIAYVPEFLVAEDLAAGRMRTVLDSFVDNPVTFWAVWPASRHASPKLRAFVDHMRANLFARRPTTAR